MTANNMKPQGRRRRRRTGTPSLRGLQGRSATGQNGQAAKEELSAIWGAGCRKNNSGVPAGRSVFHLTSPFIGLSHRPDGCGRLTKPDISLATKSGHFNLLTTLANRPPARQMELLQDLDGAVVDEIPVPVDPNTRSLRWTSITMRIDIDVAFHTKVHVRDRVEQFQKFAIRDGGTAVQIHNLEGVVDRGM